MSEPTKSWSRLELQALAFEYMRKDVPKLGDKQGANDWYRMLGILVVFTDWMWSESGSGAPTLSPQFQSDGRPWNHSPGAVNMVDM